MAFFFTYDGGQFIAEKTNELKCDELFKELTDRKSLDQRKNKATLVLSDSLSKAKESLGHLEQEKLLDVLFEKQLDIITQAKTYYYKQSGEDFNT